MEKDNNVLDTQNSSSKNKTNKLRNALSYLAKKHFRLTIAICYILILGNILFLCANFNLKYNQAYKYSEEIGEKYNYRKINYKISFNRSNVAKGSYISYRYDNKIDGTYYDVNLYYVKENQIYVDNQNYSSMEIKNPWTIVVTIGDEKLNLVCVSGIILDSIYFIVSCLSICVIVYLSKIKNII